MTFYKVIQALRAEPLARIYLIARLYIQLPEITQDISDKRIKN